MAKNNAEKSKKKLVSRREFLAGGGAIIAAIALAACTQKTVTSIATATKTVTSTVTPTMTTTTPQPTSTIPTVTTTTLPGTSTINPKKGGTLRIIGGASAGTSRGWPADASHASGGQEYLETLLRQDAKGNTIPWLAESYKIADDLGSITLNLRKGVTFHDGSDFNASVAKWNLDNMIKSKRVSFWASVDIIDDYTIRVNLTQWVNTVLMDFGDSQAPAHMVSKVAFDKNGVDWMRSNPVGTGPFKSVSFKPDVSEKLERNPDYWIKGKPYLDGIEYISISDALTQKMAMETGEADMVSIIDPGKRAEEYAAMGLTVITKMDSNHLLAPDSANADSPWANQKVREALEYAIDREAMAKAFGYGYLQAPYQIPARGSLAYDPNFTAGRKYDMEKAKQLLTEAGYADGFKTTIIVAPMGLSANRDPVVAVQSYLAKVGIQADLEFPEMGAFSMHMGSGTWPKGTVLCVPSPMQDVYFSGGLKFIFNFIGRSWLRTDELMQTYNAAFVSSAIDEKLIRAVTDAISRDALLIPIFEAGMGTAQKPYVVWGFGERGAMVYRNVEDAWLNK